MYEDPHELSYHINLEYNHDKLACIFRSLPCQRLLNIIKFCLFMYDEQLFPYVLFNLKMGNLLIFRIFIICHLGS
jgi:hypothetical protein